MAEFNAEEYWADKPSKVWVVFVTRTFRVNGKKRTEEHHMYIRAKTAIGARRCARENTFLRGRLGTEARLATPTDLGCAEYKPRLGVAA